MQERLEDRRRQQKASAVLKMPGQAERSELFGRMDPNGNGKLSLNEFTEGLRLLWPGLSGNSEAIKRAFITADKDASGLISRKEFRLLLHYTLFFHEKSGEFHLVDSSGDGRVQLDEFAAACCKVGSSIDEESLKHEFGALDADGSGNISFIEFCTWCAQTEGSLNSWHVDQHEHDLGGEGGEGDAAAAPAAAAPAVLTHADVHKLDAARRAAEQKLALIEEQAHAREAALAEKLAEAERKLAETEDAHRLELEALKQQHGGGRGGGSHGAEATAASSTDERAALLHGTTSYREKGQNLQASFVKQLFDTVDRDGDGYITRSELIMTLRADAHVRTTLHLPRAMSDDRLHAIFSEFGEEIANGTWLTDAGLAEQFLNGPKPGLFKIANADGVHARDGQEWQDSNLVTTVPMGTEVQVTELVSLPTGVIRLVSPLRDRPVGCDV